MKLYEQYLQKLNEQNSIMSTMKKIPLVGSFPRGFHSFDSIEEIMRSSLSRGQKIKLLKKLRQAGTNPRTQTTLSSIKQNIIDKVKRNPELYKNNQTVQSVLHKKVPTMTKRELKSINKNITTVK